MLIVVYGEKTENKHLVTQSLIEKGWEYVDNPDVLKRVLRTKRFGKMLIFETSNRTLASELLDLASLHDWPAFRCDWTYYFA